MHDLSVDVQVFVRAIDRVPLLNETDSYKVTEEGTDEAGSPLEG